MIKFVRTLDLDEIPEIRDAYLGEPNAQQPDGTVEIYDLDGGTYYRLFNVNGPLAVYDEQANLVNAEDHPDLYGLRISGDT
jgi:hypothetical protein